MIPLIEEDDAERLIQRYDREGDDPLRLRDRCDDTNEAVRRFCKRMLEGRIDVPADAPVCDVDLVAAHLLAHMGVHPGAAAAIAHAACGIGIGADGEDPTVCLFHPVTRGTLESVDIRLGGARWLHGRMQVPALPETVMNAVNATADDVALARILSHPALDALRLSILWAEVASPYLHVEITLDNDHSALARAQLDEIWHGRRGGMRHIHETETRDGR